MSPNQIHINSALAWLKRAQDKSEDGGVSAWFSLINGWRPSYIETTGYIIDTFLEVGIFKNDEKLISRAIKMANFLVEMHIPKSGFRTSVPSIENRARPTVFNTGQDLLGLTSIYNYSKNLKYLSPCLETAHWLCSIQEEDGSWIKNTYGQTNHTYHTRVAWGLLKVSQACAATGYKKDAQKFRQAAIKNLNWAKKNQLSNGWFENNHLPSPNPSFPYTHTISYAIEGFWWSGKILEDDEFLRTAIKGAIPLLKYYLENDYLPGTFDSNWKSKDRYSCLTGDAQIAVMWWQMYGLTKNKSFAVGAKKINHFLKSTQKLDSLLNGVRGAIPGSDPIWGDLLHNKGYCRMAYLNWSTKFFIDSLIEEMKYEN